MSASHPSLRSTTTAAWASAALSDPVALLDDHAHLERKAAANALASIPRAPDRLSPRDRTTWTRTLASVACDETEHLRLVLRTLAARGGTPTRVHRNPYASALHRLVHAGARDELVDHLLVCALIEARSCERFEVLAGVCKDARLASLYRALGASERGHHRVFLELAELAGDVVPFDSGRSDPRSGSRPFLERWSTWLDLEARVLAAQTPGPRIHSGEPETP